MGDHRLSGLEGGVGLAPQQMQHARGPEGNSDGERMGHVARQPLAISAIRQCLIRVAKLPERQRSK
jgi:hypothetical protein